MTAPTLILHIGYPKTGTSSLQWFLDANRDELQKRQICYPLTGQAPDHSHNGLAFSIVGSEYEQWTDPQRSELFRHLVEEVERSECPTVILSSELFLARLEAIRESREFRAVLGTRQLKVVCYLRRQETFLESLYKQFIWDPATRLAGGVEDFLQTYRIAGDYHAVLSAWADFAGAENLIPVIYEQAQNAGGCIRQFCRLLDIDAAALTACDPNVRVNTTLAGTVSTEIMRIVNTYSELSPEQRGELASRARAFDATTENWPIPATVFSARHHAQVVAQYKESNRRLAEDFVRQPLEGFWFRADGQPSAATVAAQI